jgi:hypothetical protein
MNEPDSYHPVSMERAMKHLSIIMGKGNMSEQPQEQVVETPQENRGPTPMQIAMNHARICIGNTMQDDE